MIPDKIAPLSNARAARQLLRAHRYGALCTLSKKFDGHPFGSITPYLVDHDGCLLILISALAEHTKNILHDPRVSLITHNQDDPHIQTQGRITVVGSAALDENRERCGKRYLRYFPEARTYFDMPDFAFFRITPLALRYIGGFGDIHWVKAENYRLDRYPLMNEEDGLLDEINRDHRAALATLHAQTGVSDVTLMGVDCDGFDLRAGDKTWRGEFAELTLDAGQARRALLGED
jgi:putative heme iron utilization protein